jgi:hypothetical protein
LPISGKFTGRLNSIVTIAFGRIFKTGILVIAGKACTLALFDGDRASLLNGNTE